MKIVFFRHSLFDRGGDKMVFAHASHLADEGHHVSIRTNNVSTFFPFNPSITVESLKFMRENGKSEKKVQSLFYTRQGWRSDSIINAGYAAVDC
jgi:hypothetical protein